MMDTYLRQSLEALGLLSERRHAWLLKAAEQVRRWRDEDHRNGIIWSDER